MRRVPVQPTTDDSGTDRITKHYNSLCPTVMSTKLLAAAVFATAALAALAIERSTRSNLVDEYDD